MCVYVCEQISMVSRKSICLNWCYPFEWTIESDDSLQEPFHFQGTNCRIEVNRFASRRQITEVMTTHRSHQFLTFRLCGGWNQSKRFPTQIEMKNCSYHVASTELWTWKLFIKIKSINIKTITLKLHELKFFNEKKKWWLDFSRRMHQIQKYKSVFEWIETWAFANVTSNLAHWNKSNDFVDSLHRLFAVCVCVFVCYP